MCITTVHLRNLSRVRKGAKNLLTRISHSYRIHTYHLPFQMYPILQPPGQNQCILIFPCTPNKELSKEHTVSTCTQSVQPALGFTLAEVCHAEENPTLMVPQLLESKLCREYTETPLKTLDGLYVTQPKRFLPLAQEALKLAKELRKQEIASQWTGLPPEKLLQESFLDQLDALQALNQLAPLTAAKEHLPGNIINILSCLGKVDNIPFDQLYRITEDCAD